LGVGLTTLPCKKKIVEKPPRNSAGFCGGGQGLSWAVEPRKEDIVHVSNSHRKSNILGAIESRRWAGHVARMGDVICIQNFRARN
jgi:hypothetical protein